MRWRDEIEVLFGSEPERIPGRVSRWGYGLEAAVWGRDSVAASPALAGTEFQGIMRHSKEASLKDVVPESRNKDARPYDVTRSVVLPGRASHEFRFFSDAEDFYYRHPERLLARFRNCLANDPPLRRTALNGGPYGEPYGFLTALSAILAGLPETAPRPREPVRIARPSAVFVFNAKLYHLNVAGSHVAPSFKMKYGGLHVADVLVLNFQCLNTYKHTRTDFSLWIPMTGRLRGVPIRILLQPRWWLRLQLDLDLGAGSAAAALEDCISVSGGTSR